MKSSILLCAFLAGSCLLHAVSAAPKCCATTNVNIRSGPSTKYRIAGLLRRHRCLPTKGLSSNHTWVKVVYGGNIRYIYEKFCPIRSRVTTPPSPRCCATTNVNIRTGPGIKYSKVGLLTRGRCLPTRGLSNDGSWVKVVYGRRIRYIYEQFCPVAFKPANPSNPPNPTNPTNPTNSASPPPTTDGCPNIISRSQWGARRPKGIQMMRSMPGNVYVHHTTGPSCSSTDVCKRKVRGHQRFHMDTRGWNDIGYTFLIGEDGNVYEGRGWNVVGSHTKGHNSDGYGIAFIGDFTNRNPNALAQSTFHRLVQCGITTRQLRSNYVLRGHRDVVRTSCPGDTLYNVVKSWPHYKNSQG